MICKLTNEEKIVRELKLASENITKILTGKKEKRKEVRKWEKF